MLEDFKDLFARSWEAFARERDRREPEDAVAEMLGAMRRELVEARAALPLHDEAVAAAAVELERERRQRADCERRRSQAEKIGDVETARVAAEWAERHGRREAVLREKHSAAVAERDLARTEADEMARQYRAADANRWGLVAEVRRRGAAGITGGIGGAAPDPSRADFDRLDVDARLAELKRRMAGE